MAGTRFGNIRFIFFLAALFVLASPQMTHAQAMFGEGAAAAPPVPTGLYVYTDIKDNVVVEWDNNPGKQISTAEYHIFRLENNDPQNTLKMVGVVQRDPSKKTMVFTDVGAPTHRLLTYFLTSRDAFGNESPNSKMKTYNYR